MSGRLGTIEIGIAGHANAIEIMGVTIGSQSFDQSLIEHSMTSELKRKLRNKK